MAVLDVLDEIERQGSVLNDKMAHLLRELRGFTPSNPATPEFCQRWQDVVAEQAALAQRVARLEAAPTLP